MHEASQIIGSSVVMAAVRGQLAQLVARLGEASRPPAIFILGETGVGKGLLARAFHQASVRRQGPWVEVNCAAIPETLVEAELFGVERGAFTDARQSKAGLFQAAHHGMLFLDEVTSLSLAVQAKLLTALDQRHVRRLGSTRPEVVDVWIISATNEDVRAAVDEKRFRSDLYHRLAGMTLRLPPLRERGRDVLELAEYYLRRACADYGFPPKQLAADAQAALLAHTWPGNVRELANLMDRIALLSDVDVVTAEGLSLPESQIKETGHSRMRHGASVEQPRRADRASTAGEILVVLQQTKWNLSRAAAELGIPRNTLRYRIEKFDLWPEPSPAGSRRGGLSVARASSVAEPPSGGDESTATGQIRGALRWEKGLVVVLRVDLTPSGQLISAFAPRLQDLVDKLQGFGARIEELSPWAVVVVFGFEPVDDAAGLAVHAAVAVNTAVKRARELGSDHPPVSCRIHAADCLLSRGTTGGGLDPTDKRMLWDVLESLRTATPQGTIVVSAAAARLIERRVALEPVGPTADVSFAAYRVLGPNRSRFVVGDRAPSPFLGRDRDLEILDDLLALAEQGQGQFVTVVGEPGVGKSRLLHEFHEGLGPERVTYLEGRCVSYGQAMPYLPLGEVLRHYFRIPETDASYVVRDKLGVGLEALGLDVDATAPYLLHLLGVKEGTQKVFRTNPDVVRQHTIEAVEQIFLAESRRNPLIVAVEDVQWIDPTSQECFEKVANVLAAARILLIMTVRLGHPVKWLGRSYATQLVLRRLTRADSLAVVHALTTDDILPPPLADTIVERSDGIPLFLEELSRAVTDHAEFRTTSAIPDTIHGVLFARLDRLPTQEKQLLQAAAALGRDVPIPVLRDITDLPEAEFSQHLERLQAAEFLVATNVSPLREYRFKHALTQEVAYRSLLTAQRCELHARSAAALEHHLPELRERRPEVFAHHYTEAGLGRLALVWWQRAGQRAVEHSANVEAVDHLRKGLALLTAFPDGPERVQLELGLQVALGVPLMASLGLASLEVEAAYARARELAERLGRRPQLLPVLAGLWRFYLSRAEYRTARALDEQLLLLADETNQRAHRLEALRSASQTSFFLGDFGSASARLTDALALYDTAEHASHAFVFGHEPGVACLAFDALLLWLRGDQPSSQVRLRESLELARRLAHPPSLSLALTLGAVLHQWRDDTGAARLLAQEALALSTGSKLPMFTAWSRIQLGWAAVQDGETTSGLAEMRDAVVATRRMGLGLFQGYILTLLAVATMRAGEIGSAMGILAEAVAHCDETGEGVYVPDMFRAQAQLLALQGDDLAAEASLWRSLQVAAAHGANMQYQRSTHELARLLTRRGREEDARRIVAQANDRHPLVRDSGISGAAEPPVVE